MKLIFISAILTLLSFSSINSGVLKYNLFFGDNDYSIREIEGRSFIEMSNGFVSAEKGSPSLPALKLLYSIPSGSVVRKVETMDENWLYLGNYRIFPSQGLVRTGENFSIVPENPEIYSKDVFTPDATVGGISTGNKSGFAICGFDLRPFKYNPVTGELYFLNDCQVVIHYDEGLGENIFLTESQSRIFTRDVENIVENPLDAAAFRPLVKELRDSANEYIIVTPQNLAGEFDELLEWKSRKGFSSSVVSAEWIYANYSGYDNMEKIRYFIQDMHQNHGLIYLVLAGDYDNLGARIIPIRNYSTTENTPADLYFSDVVPYTSNWDANGNHIFGEYSGDGCDWYSDVYVGRFPLNSASEVQRWTEKVIEYESNPSTGYHERSLMAGAGLWPSVNYYGDRVCNYITDNCLPVAWQHNKMYQTDTLSYPQGFPDSFSQGYAWCQLAGHGNIDGVYWYEPGGAMLSGTTASMTTNGSKLGVIHSMACEPGWFDSNECMGEKLFNAANGGAIAVQFNARYGWGSPPSLGPSEWLCIWLAEVIFVDQTWNIGAAHGLSKDRMVPGMSQGEHWCVTELNLFADPETPIYSMEPSGLNVSNNPVVNLGPVQYTVSVVSAKGPVSGALCCMSDKDDPDLKFRAFTDASGNAVINCNFVSTTDAVLTVTAQDCRAFLDTIIATSSSSFIAFTGIETLQGGYQNGQINTGCNYSLKLNVSNFGSQTANGVRGVLSCSETGIAFSPDTMIFGDINPSDTTSSSNSAAFHVQNNIFDGTTFIIDLVCFDQNDSSWQSSFEISVNSPDIDFTSLKGPQTAGPGDTMLLTPVIRNNGSADAVNPAVKLRCSNPYATVLDSSENIQSINSGSTAELYRQFSISISENCPEPSYIDLVFELKTESLDVFSDTFTVYVGEAFTEDFEGTMANWTFSGPSCWHVTQHASNSPVNSMYSGVENTWTYTNSIVNARVVTPTLTISRGSELSFWHKYEIYDNKDKVQVQISTNAGSTWLLVNPVQGYTGKWAYSPYDSIYTGSQPSWQRQDFVLDYEGEVLLSWLFFSNPVDNAEGYYFDDVSVALSSGLTGVEEPEIPVYNGGFEVFKAFPNPTFGRILISYALGSSSFVEISVYDLTGREVLKLFEGDQIPGRYAIEWDGRNDRGELVSSGTYFYRVTAGNSYSGDKFIVVR